MSPSARRPRSLTLGTASALSPRATSPTVPARREKSCLLEVDASFLVAWQVRVLRAAFLSAAPACLATFATLMDAMLLSCVSVSVCVCLCGLAHRGFFPFSPHTGKIREISQRSLDL